jgi:hypothetical protein
MPGIAVVSVNANGSPVPTPAGGAASANLQAAPASGPYFLTLTGSTVWTYAYLTATSGGNNSVMLFNQSPSDPLLWYLDFQSATAPPFNGISLSAGTNPLVLPITPGQVLHWHYPSSSDNGYSINLSK